MLLTSNLHTFTINFLREIAKECDDARLKIGLFYYCLPRSGKINFNENLYLGNNQQTTHITTRTARLAAGVNHGLPSFSLKLIFYSQLIKP